jgi:tetratricopeptide (TPR) repeat protein
MEICVKAQSDNPGPRSLLREKERLLAAPQREASIALELHRLGASLRDAAEFMPALECFQQALAILEETVGPFNPGLAAVVNDVGTALWDLGRPEDARECYERALTLLGQQSSPSPLQLAIFRFNLGEALAAVGRREDARGQLIEARTYFQAEFGSAHWRTQAAQRILDAN